MRVRSEPDRSRFALPCLLACAVLAGACRREAPAAGPGERRAEPIPVTVEAAALRSLERTLPVLGTLQANDRASLSVRITGRLRELRVDVGSAVRTGDVLATLERRDFELGLQQAAAQLAQARARLGLPLDGADDAVELSQVSFVREARARFEEAQANRERVRRLRGEGISSDSELDRAEAEYAVTANRYQDALQDARERAALLVQRRVEHEIAGQRLVDTELRAPYDGIIQARLAGTGEFIAAGTPVVSMVRIDPLRLRMEVPERLASQVRTGQVVRASVAGEEGIHEGRVARVSPALDERSRMLVVEADLPNPGHLRPGAFARAEVVVADPTPVLTIPADALVTFAGTEKALLVRTNVAHEVRVTVGRRQGPWVEVLEGLQPGARVVRNPGGLQSGDPVRVTGEEGDMGSSGT